MEFFRAGLEIVTHWSPMRPKIEDWRLNFQNWSPAGDSRFVRWLKKTTTQLLFLDLYIRKSIEYGSQYTIHLSVPSKIMSEYYKIIEKIECISKRRYCVHDAPYCFSGFFRNWDRRRTSTPCAFHLPRKWWQIQISSRNYMSFHVQGMKIKPKG